jgi:hypothetical protein
MSCIRIQTGQIEPIVAVVVDIAGDLLPGKTNIKIRIRRNSDGYYFDWSDDTFKTAGTVAQMLQQLVEISATFSPGEYELHTGATAHNHGFDTSKITNPASGGDDYFFTCIQDGGSDASNLPQSGEIKVGGFIDDIQEDRSPVIF